MGRGKETICHRFEQDITRILIIIIIMVFIDDAIIIVTSIRKGLNRDLLVVIYCWGWGGVVDYKWPF